jgi:hypothetical protein
MTKSHIGFFLLLTTLFACGGDSHNDDDFDREEENLPEPEVLQRVYRTDLKPVNPLIVKRVEGQAIIRLEDDSFEVSLGVQNVPSSIHRQHIHTLKSCPTKEADTNNDRTISRAEAEAISGPVFIPLDSDLDNVGEDGRYPDGGFLKAYVYREETVQSRLLADLGRGANFDLENRVILIFGTDDDQNLPIACGELVRVIGRTPP